LGQRNFGAEVNTDGTYGAACGTGPAAKGSSDTLPMVFWVRNYKHRNQIVPKPLELKLVHEDQNIIDPKQMELKKKNIPWAWLLARVFNIDVETCINQNLDKHSQ
jgi:hypothetical protein